MVFVCIAHFEGVLPISYLTKHIDTQPLPQYNNSLSSWIHLPHIKR